MEIAIIDFIEYTTVTISVIAIALLMVWWRK